MEEKKDGCFSSDVIREGEDNVLRVDCDKCSFFPSVEDNSLVMSKITDLLIENPGISRIVLYQKRDYEYDYEQTRMLAEIAALQAKLIKSGFAAYSVFGINAKADRRYAELQNLIRNTLKADPLAAYVELTRMHRRETLRLEATPKEDEEQQKRYTSLLESLGKTLAATKLVTMAKPHLAGYKPGDRTAYRELFRAMTKPDFMFTKLMASFPSEGEEIDSYTVKDTEIAIFKVPDTIKMLYHMTPPEFKLSEDKYELLDAARAIVSEHKPQRTEFVDPERLRQVFSNIGSDLIEELAGFRGIKLRNSEVQELTRILVRHTIGFGMVEVLLQDEKVQDITINSPMGNIPIFIVHQDYDDCLTNLIPTPNEGESWASKLRLLSGRPLDEANPILDTELAIPYARARVAVISPPLNPTGLAYAFRRHRDKPWTLPLFIKNRMMSTLSAGLLSFLIDGARTMLVAGTRSAGKTSLLGAVMTEIMRKYRLITIEDTLELPVSALKDLGYNVQQMKVASAMTRGTTEVPADEGIRTTLRMGDSGLIVGEVRSSIRGDQEVFIIEKGLTKRIPIRDAEKLEPDDCKVPTLDFNLKTRLLPLTAFVKHPERKKLLEVRTRTGRSIIVTEDHSLFTATRDFRLAAIECKDLKTGSQIVIPTNIPVGYNDIESLDLMKILPSLRLKKFEAPLKQAISVLGYRTATELCKVPANNDIYMYLRTGKHQKTNIPIASFETVMSAAKLPIDSDQLSRLAVTKGTGNEIPAVIPVNEDFCAFLGYLVSEGYYSPESDEGGSAILTNSDPKVLHEMTSICERLFKITPKMREVRGAGVSYQLRISSVALVELLKRLQCGRICTEKRIPPMMFGLSKKKIAAFLSALYEGDGCITVSKSSGNSIRYDTTSEKLADDLAYLLLPFGIVARIYKKAPKKGNPLWTVEFKSREMVESFMNNIGFRFKGKELLKRKWAHSKANTAHFDKSAVKEHLTKYPRRYRHLLRFGRCSKTYLQKVVNDPECEVSQRLKIFANGEFFLDEITQIREILLDEPEPVYDLSVAPSQNFVGGFGGILLHNTEAKALYEAMRVGALANVVAGTIHGDSPYGVFDRVVNDLGVPKTSFKATDIIVVANPIRSADGLHRWRRVTQITEVGKFWEEDPLAEKGFKDLMKYDSQSDSLEPTTDLLNGDSDVLKSIAANVKEWAGSWDAVWDNITLRAKLKETLVRYSEEAKMPELLEAGFTIQSNDEFHRISDETREELGYLDSKRIFFDWNEWTKKSIKKQSIRTQ
ncbi:Flp pilus assembly complex ATPase component TadA [Candidatus Woesearchaeota archaeon]|nr:Flp pilus assembly complex ATPase component TadA [Candidatus Woesearchaeota archaeon]